MPKVYQGSRGGLYYKKNGKKVYLTESQKQSVGFGNKYIKKNRNFNRLEQGMLNLATMESMSPQNRALNAGFGLNLDRKINQVIGKLQQNPNQCVIIRYSNLNGQNVQRFFLFHDFSLP